MADIGEARRDTGHDRHGFSIGGRHELLEGILRILHRIKRINGRFARAQVFPRLVFRLLLLDVAAVRKHDAGKLHSGLRCDDASFESLLHEQGDEAGMVDMRMR